MINNQQLTYIEKQTIKYTKLHFKFTDMIEDLKVLTSREYALPIEYTEIYNVYHFMVSLYTKLQNLGYIQTTMEKFLLELFRFERTIDQTGIIRKIYGEIQIINVLGLDLGEPDYSILPPKTRFEITGLKEITRNTDFIHVILAAEFDSKTIELYKLTVPEIRVSYDVETGIRMPNIHVDDVNIETENLKLDQDEIEEVLNYILRNKIEEEIMEEIFEIK